MSKEKVLLIKLMLFTGAIVPTFFDWCSYGNVVGFKGDVMLTNPFFMLSVFILICFANNIYIAVTAFASLIVSYVIPVAGLINHLEFLPKNMSTVFSLTLPSAKISFCFALAVGLFSVVNSFLQYKKIQ